MATTDQRAHMAAVMDWLVAERARIFWHEIRPMTTRGYTEQTLVDHFQHGGTITMDCSESVTLICRFAGLADPNGNHYNGQGFTGTLLGHLPHYEQANMAGVGALVVFGPGTGEHVCMVREPGDDPLLFSHGSDPDPTFRRLSVERGFHKPPVTFLSVARL